MIEKIRYYLNDTFFQVFIAVALALGLGFWLGQEVSLQRESASQDELRPTRIIERKKALPPLEPPEPVSPQMRSPPPPADSASPPPDTEDPVEETLLAICQSDWSRLATREVSLLEDDFIHLRPLFSQDCVQAMLREVDHLAVVEFLTGCHLGRLELQDWQVGACLGLVPGVRDFVIVQMAQMDPPLQELNLTELQDRLYASHRYISEMSLEELNRNLDLADELVARNPRSYLGYKSKMLSLLLREVKFNQAVDPNEYIELYDQLLRFDVAGPEAEILAEAYALDPFEQPPFLAAQELVGMDRDLIHLPFVRLSALNDLDSLMDVSLEYIDFYPDSYIGYFYLAESHWRMGDEASAFNTLKMGLDLPDSDEMLLRLLSQFQRSPLARIYQMAGSD